MTRTQTIEAWVVSLIDAVETAGPQRLESDGRAPVMVVSLEAYRALVGYRPSFIDTLDAFGIPATELPGEQSPFNLVGHPVPSKY